LRSERSEFYPEISAEMPVAAARVPKHLRLMREIGSQQSTRHRARELGRELALESAPGGGTRVRFKIPVSRLVGEGDPVAQGDRYPRVLAMKERRRHNPLSEIQERRPTAIADQAEDDPIRILLVEDHASFRQALAFMLEMEPGFEVVGQIGSLTEARALTREMLEEVEVAIVDLALPDGDGLDLIEDFSSQPRTVTLVLSASLEAGRFARAVGAGASGVLHKSTSIEDIVDAVRKLKAGEALLSPGEVVEMLRLVGRERQEELAARRAVERLTPREKEVLQALAEGLESREIAEKLSVTVETERTHMVNILHKLGVHSRLQALVFAARYGVVKIR
jgi:two-component system, NarL family, nitrate/nitrite response regulator NarL